MNIENKQKYLNEDSLGFTIIKSLEKEERVKNKNKKDTAFNIKINNKDLEILDFIAESFNVKRAYILNLLITAEISEMFNALPTKECFQLAEYVDGELTKMNAEHSFRGETWMHDVKQVPYEVDDPSEPSVFFKTEDKLKIKEGNNNE